METWNFGGNWSRTGFCQNVRVMFKLCRDEEVAAVLSVNIKVPLLE